MKRLWLLLLILPVVLILVPLGVAFFTCRDIAPPDTSDLVPKRVEVADDQNAFTHFNAAAAALDWPEDEHLIWDIAAGRKSDPQYVADLLARNEKAVALLERGLRCRICQSPEVRSFSDPLDYSYQWRKLSKLLTLKVDHNRKAGRIAEAAKTCRQQIRLGELIEEHPACFINYLIGITILGQGLESSRALAADGGTSRDDLTRLAQALDRVSRLDQGLVRALKCEYQMSANTIDDLRDGKMDLHDLAGRKTGRSRRASIGYFFQPNKTKQMFAEICRNNIENVALPRAKRKFIDQEEMVGAKKHRVMSMLAPNQVGRILVCLLAPAVDALLEAQCRTDMHLAATRLIVACGRYEKDHGQLPPTLDALVPKYLNAVPADPYDGKPFRYLPDRAVVYSVSKDLKDSGGSEKSTTGEAYESEIERLVNAEDAIFYIHGRPKPKGPAESTESAETSKPADSP